MDAPHRDTLAVGLHHSCAIHAGHVFCWGSNVEGQLGDRGGVSRATPAPVAGIEDAVQIDADDARTCAVKATGRVVCWGGDRPAIVEAPGITTATQVSVGPWHACAVLRSGEVRCWGKAWLGGGSVGSDGPSVASLTDIADGVEVRDHCVLRRNGEVRCWGLNASGDVGDGTDGYKPSPVPVRGIDDAIAIAAGSMHACALRRSGEVACWGSGALPATNDGGLRAFSRVPVAVPGLNDGVAISARGQTTCVMRKTSEVSCWGPAVYGRLGDRAGVPVWSDQPDTSIAAPVPELVPKLDGAVEIAAGVDHACARRKDAGLVCWGRNGAGQLGTSIADHVEGISDAVRVVGGPTTSAPSAAAGASRVGAPTIGCSSATAAEGTGPRPSSSAGIAGAERISASTEHTCAVIPPGMVSCWGAFVPGTDAAAYEACASPCRVTSIADAVDVATDFHHSCVRHRSGAVSCWGELSYVPPVKRGGVEDDKVPSPVRGIRDAVDVISTNFGGCVVRRTGGLVCWGVGAIEALEPGGPGASPPSDVAVGPTLLRGVRDVVGVSNFSMMTCLLRRSGAVHCWNTDRPSLLPENPLPPDTEITGLAEAVALRGELVVLKRGDLALLSNDHGNDRRYVAAPFRPEIKDAVDAAGTELSGCAVRKTGEVTCWGLDDHGPARSRLSRALRDPVEVLGWPPQ